MRGNDGDGAGWGPAAAVDACRRGHRRSDPTRHPSRDGTAGRDREHRRRDPRHRPARRGGAAAAQAPGEAEGAGFRRAAPGLGGADRSGAGRVRRRGRRHGQRRRRALRARDGGGARLQRAGVVEPHLPRAAARPAGAHARARRDSRAGSRRTRDRAARRRRRGHRERDRRRLRPRRRERAERQRPRTVQPHLPRRVDRAADRRRPADRPPPRARTCAPRPAAADAGVRGRLPRGRDGDTLSRSPTPTA